MYKTTLFLLSVGLFSSIVHAEFGPATLTKEDVISVYSVPVEDEPAYKYVWTVAKPCKIELIFEQKDEVSGVWKKLQTSVREVKESAYLIIRYPPTFKTRTPDEPVVYAIRWGFNQGHATGWTSFDLTLPRAGNPITTTIRDRDPSNFMEITTQSGHYRLRVQSL